MRRLVLAVALVALGAGCYAPAANPGAPCSASGACPSGQECRSGTCYAVGAPHDADALAVDAPDGAMNDAMPDAAAYVPWTNISELTSLESAGNSEGDPSITADKLTVVFAADTATNDGQIFIATRTALTDTFTITELTAVSATGFNEKSPEISADGKTLYFSSNRSGSYEFYSSTFTTSWSAPALRTDLSSGGDDEDLAISPDGLTAVTVLDAAINTFRVHTRASTADPFDGGSVHGELSVMNDVASPTITNGGEVIYLHAGTTRQIYRATRKGNGDYTTPALVDELNVTGVHCAAPFVLQTDDYMIFNRSSDIYEASRTLP